MPSMPRERRTESTISFPSLSTLMQLSLKRTLFPQLSDVTKEPGPAHKAVLSRCIMLQGKERRLGDALPCRGSSLPVLGRREQLPANAECDFFPAAQTCPEETVMFLHSQLSSGSEAGRVAALGLLGALAHSDGQCHMPETQGRGWGYWAESRNGLKVVHSHPKGAAKSGSPSRADAPRQGLSSPSAVRNGGTPGMMLLAQ